MAKFNVTWSDWQGDPTVTSWVAADKGGLTGEQRITAEVERRLAEDDPVNIGGENILMARSDIQGYEIAEVVEAPGPVPGAGD